MLTVQNHRLPDIDSAIGFPHATEQGRELAGRLAGQTPLFVCVIGGTDTALIPGISAAGATPDLIPFTAAADAEVLVHGAARCIAGVPSNPLGPPGPSLIALAALQLGGIPHCIVDAGCRIHPDAPTIQLGGRPGGSIVSGNAVPKARELFEQGRRLGEQLAGEHPYLVIGESVPGGTTTALALLLALGYAADGRVSSSMAGNAHELKSAVAAKALSHCPPRGDALALVAQVGDPMQPVVAGLALGALMAATPVLLAGGSQMVAILALLVRLAQQMDVGLPVAGLGVATTRWVAEDPTADVPGLMADIGEFPLLTTRLSFASSPHAQLRRYEDFLVKEGVGAGGAAVAASLAADVTAAALQTRVEELYGALLNA